MDEQIKVFEVHPTYTTPQEYLAALSSGMAKSGTACPYIPIGKYSVSLATAADVIEARVTTNGRLVADLQIKPSTTPLITITQLFDSSASKDLEESIIPELIPGNTRLIEVKTKK